MSITKTKWQDRKKAILFDFNGTLFFDSQLHEKAWAYTIEKICGRKITREEIENHIHGRHNKAIVEYFCNGFIANNDFDSIASQKEELYRKLCVETEGFLKLAPGAVELLDLLIKNEIQINIATAADYGNVSFYIEKLNLSRWFDTSKIVFDNGTLPPKPNPQIYVQAAANINQSLANCIIVEDSLPGLNAGLNAGADEVIFISGDSEIKESQLPSEVKYRIPNFIQFPKHLIHI